MLACIVEEALGRDNRTERASERQRETTDRRRAHRPPPTGDKQQSDSRRSRVTSDQQQASRTWNLAKRPRGKGKGEGRKNPDRPSFPCLFTFWSSRVKSSFHASHGPDAAVPHPSRALPLAPVLLGCCVSSALLLIPSWPVSCFPVICISYRIIHNTYYLPACLPSTTPALPALPALPYQPHLPHLPASPTKLLSSLPPLLSVLFFCHHTPRAYSPLPIPHCSS